MADVIDKYVSIVPDVRQKRLQRENFNVFFHYGLNTFTGKEWGDGKVDPRVFDPDRQNTDQWVKTAKDAGAYGVILTCKHHDGFCLWPTSTTSYNISATPYKNGRGDVVKEVSESCAKYGMKFGVYLSPWDRNHPAYSTPAYNDVYCTQLTELLGNYGDVFCVWMDGACGAYMDGKEKQEYDWDRYFALIRKLAPNACISNCGPDVRWVGNEGGFARESEWNVVPKFAYDIQTIEDNSQKADDVKFAQKGADVVFSDLGSRKFLSRYDNFIWYPAEVDVSVRPGWFYHKSQDNMVRSLDSLLRIYYTSVGGNSLLLLNFPPDRHGLIHENDVKLAKALGKHIDDSRKQLLEIKEIKAPLAEKGHDPACMTEDLYDKKTGDPLSYYTPAEENGIYCIEIRLSEKKKVNRVRIAENTAFSQRIEKFEIYADNGRKLKKVYEGSTVGYNRICIFPKAVLTDKLTLVISQCRKKPYIEFLGVYEDNGVVIRKPRFFRLKQFIHERSYKWFIEKENKKYCKK